MSCHETREMLSALVDEALTPDEQARVEAHLSECADCRKEHERLGATVTLLQRMERPRAPVGFVDRVMAAARPEPWYRRWFGRLFLPFSVKLPAEAAALLLVGGLAVFVFQRTPELQQAAHQTPSPQISLDKFSPVPSQPSPPIAARPAPQTDPDAVSRVAKSTPPRAATPVPPPATPSAGPSSNVLLRSPAPARDEGTPEQAKEKARTMRDERAAESAGKVVPGSPEPTAPASQPTDELKADELKAQALKREADAASKSAVLGAARKTAQPPAVSSPSAGPPLAPMPAPAPALERQDASPREQALQLKPSAPAPPSSRMRVLPSADVIGRLTVKDLSAARQALADLVAQSGGVITAQRDDAGTVLVEAAIPRPGYAEFNAGLSRIGSWQPEGEPAESATSVRVTLRLVP